MFLLKVSNLIIRLELWFTHNTNQTESYQKRKKMLLIKTTATSNQTESLLSQGFTPVVFTIFLTLINSLFATAITAMSARFPHSSHLNFIKSNPFSKHPACQFGDAAVDLEPMIT